MAGLRIFINASWKPSSLVIIIALSTISSSGSTFAREIRDRMLTENDAELRLGFNGNEFERFIRPNVEYEHELKDLVFPEKVIYIY